MTEEDLLSPIPCSESHPVRSSVSGMAPLSNLFSPIPSSSSSSSALDNNHSPSGESDHLRSQIFAEQKVVKESVVVETVDEESVESMDCARERALVMSDHEQMIQEMQKEGIFRRNKRDGLLSCSENTQWNAQFDQFNADIVEALHEETCDPSAGKDHSRDGNENQQFQNEPASSSDRDDLDTGENACVTKRTPSNAQNDNYERENMSISVERQSKEMGKAIHELLVSSRNEMSDEEDVLVNESFNSTGSNREEEIQQAQDALGATSMAFMDRLRGASLRRKMNLARSRDSLANKERAQREAIAASQAAKSAAENIFCDTREEQKDSSDVSQFKARPLSKAILKSGGISGVRFIEKRPVTTPLSPLLGSRRENRQSTEQATKGSSHDTAELSVFKARPWVRNKIENAGTYGVPKVEKRPTTVPESPLLGHRRRKKQSPVPQKKKDALDRPIFKTPASSPHLFGLSMFNQGSSTDKENGAHSNRVYIPHSTRRASQRAEYDLQRREREQKRSVRKRRESLRQVKTLREEMNLLLAKL